MQASHHAFVLHACQINTRKKIEIAGMQNSSVQSVVNFCEIWNVELLFHVTNSKLLVDINLYLLLTNNLYLTMLFWLKIVIVT